MARFGNDTSAQPPELTHEIEFYWRPGCPFCMALEAGLAETGAPFTKVNIWEDEAAAARVRAAADGNETVPTVFVGDTALVNPSAAEVIQAATA